MSLSLTQFKNLGIIGVGRFVKAIENVFFSLFLSHQMQFVLGDVIISITSLVDIFILPHSTLSLWHSMTPTQYFLHLQVLPCG